MTTPVDPWDCPGLIIEICLCPGWIPMVTYEMCILGLPFCETSCCRELQREFISLRETLSTKIDRLTTHIQEHTTKTSEWKQEIINTIEREKQSFQSQLDRVIDTQKQMQIDSQRYIERLENRASEIMVMIERGRDADRQDRAIQAQALVNLQIQISGLRSGYQDRYQCLPPPCPTQIIVQQAICPPAERSNRRRSRFRDCSDSDSSEEGSSDDSDDYQPPVYRPPMPPYPQPTPNNPPPPPPRQILDCRPNPCPPCPPWRC